MRRRCIDAATVVNALSPVDRQLEDVDTRRIAVQPWFGQLFDHLLERGRQADAVRSETTPQARDRSAEFAGSVQAGMVGEGDQLGEGCDREHQVTAGGELDAESDRLAPRGHGC